MSISKHEYQNSIEALSLTCVTCSSVRSPVRSVARLFFSLSSKCHLIEPPFVYAILIRQRSIHIQSGMCMCHCDALWERRWQIKLIYWAPRTDRMFKMLMHNCVYVCVCVCRVLSATGFGHFPIRKWYLNKLLSALSSICAGFDSAHRW